MKKISLSWVFILIMMHSLAQDARSLIAAEKDFEKTCLAKGIRDGFLAFVDSNAIEFNEKGPVNGKKFWTSLPPFEGVFSWSPTIAEISALGNWGYTSGNYEHRPKSVADAPDEFGQYTTVWQLYPDGQWKYIIDIGNPHPQAVLGKTTRIISTSGKADEDASEIALIEFEKNFIHEFNKDISQAYENFCSNSYHLNLSGYATIALKDSAVTMLKNHFSKLEYHPAGAKIASGKDMAAMYGTLVSDGKPGSYLRIWRHERNGWRIALEVIRD